MDYNKLIKLCQKYNIDYKNHYGKNKSYIKLKRKVDNYENIKKKQKVDNNNCKYYNLNNDELGTAIRTRLFYIGD